MEEYKVNWFLIWCIWMWAWTFGMVLYLLFIVTGLQSDVRGLCDGFIVYKDNYLVCETNEP